MVWGAIRDRVDWRNKSVLDIGCNFGFYSFQASRAGARVRGIDKNENVIRTARLINDRVEMQDVQFEAAGVQSLPPVEYDVIFYFSVQHQFDRSYAKLKKQINALWALTRERLFIELIVPSLDGAMSEEQVDLIVDGTELLRYKHKVRACRKLYEVKRGS
jgi:SAM-dependent methyltransferase